jgi:hypothetical protein
VKLPAAWRRDVYRERPQHEQETWLENIRSHVDPEAAFERIYPESMKDQRSFRQRTVASARSKLALRSRVRQRGVNSDSNTTSAAEQRRLERRVFKGLDD